MRWSGASTSYLPALALANVFADAGDGVTELFWRWLYPVVDRVSVLSAVNESEFESI